MSLHQKTLLVSLNIKAWSANKKDPKATREVNEKHGARDAGVFRKYLIDPEALKNIGKVASEARTYHYEHTLPWGDKGNRILTTTVKPDYDHKMRIFKDDYQFQVQTFLKDYPRQIEVAKEKLNGLFNPDEYPAVDELSTRFDFRTQVMPVPHVDDFRIELAQEDMNNIRADLARQLEEATLSAQRDLWLRLHQAVGLVNDTLKNPKRRWVKGTFQKFEDMAEVIAQLNFTENTELIELAQKAKDQFVHLDLALCKQNTNAREAAAKEAESLLNRTAQFI